MIKYIVNKFLPEVNTRFAASDATTVAQPFREFIPALYRLFLLLVKTLIQLIPAMGNMLVLFGFTVLIFATIGMQLFGGSLSKRCILESTRNDLAFKSETR